MHRFHVPSQAAALLVVVALAAGCGASTSSTTASSTPPDATAASVVQNAPEVSPAGDIPDNPAFVEYAPPGGGYAVKVPEGWALRTGGRTATFADKLNAIRIEAARTTKAPTVAAATATEVPALKAAATGFRLTDVKTVTRAAGDAVLITYLAASRHDPVTGKSVTDAVERYEFFRNGRQVVLTLSGPKGADNVDPWRIVTDSLRWTA